MRQALGIMAIAALASCSSDRRADTPPAPPCELAAAPLRVRFDPPSLVLGAGASRPARIVVEPDLCQKRTVVLSAHDPAIARAPGGADVDPDHPAADVDVAAGGLGATIVTATLAREDGATASADLAVEVRDPALPACDAALKSARLMVPDAAFTRNDELTLPRFDPSLACDADLAAGAGLAALGPAVRFGASSTGQAGVSAARPLRREIGFSIPVNPALLPRAARMRHVRVLYQGPRAKTARPIVVANARFEKKDDAWVLSFSSPWLGTYQAAFAPDAGAKKRTRHLTHRALFGISMGAGGVATVGLRHHELFDAIAMLGGPVDWTWLLWYVETFPMGGFCRKGQPCNKTAPGAYPMNEPFVHTMDYDHLWNQDGNGTGGLERSEYGTMLTDLALVRGNPVSENADPAFSFLPAGIHGDAPFVTGDQGCGGYAVRPLKGADEAAEKARQDACNLARCDPKRAFVFPSGYFDAEYNPDGTEQVISFCDGAQAPGAKSPYKGEYVTPSAAQALPVVFTLAVDTNKNGVRDPGEPILRHGHEPFDDTGKDGLFDKDEPGYDAEANPDPSQDDYDAQINPGGAEGNHARDEGEPFKDDGLDGVPNTASRNVAGDVGEGDDVYTESRGLRAFRAVDPSAFVKSSVSADALARLSLWTDGGVRDFLNFGAASRHLHGSIASRAPGLGAFVNGFAALPGAGSGQLVASDILWSDLPRVVGVRYGDVDASPEEIAKGDGQHVGSGDQIIARIGAGFAFVGSAWPDADRAIGPNSSDDPLGDNCEIVGRCDFDFAGPKSGRTAPVTVNLPPGYAHASRRERRYPVLYVFHGYGQTEDDVSGLAFLTTSAMRDTARSIATRLPQLIVVYVDGRCRPQKNGQPDCIAGTFFMDGDRPGSPKVETWFLELMDEIDRRFRTSPPADVEDVE